MEVDVKKKMQCSNVSAQLGSVEKTVNKKTNAIPTLV